MYRRPWLPVPPANTDADVWGRSFHWSIRQQKVVWMMGFTLALLFIGADHCYMPFHNPDAFFKYIYIYIDFLETWPGMRQKKPSRVPKRKIQQSGAKQHFRSQFNSPLSLVSLSKLSKNPSRSLTQLLPLVCPPVFLQR